MLVLDLKKIILNADFGPLRMGSGDAEKAVGENQTFDPNLGSSFEEVEAILGPPNSKQDNQAGSLLVHYDWYEFFFFDDELHYFQNDHLKADCANHNEMFEFENDKFKFDSWFLEADRDFTLREVVAMLEAENAQFIVKDEDYRVGELKRIQMANGVVIDFENFTTVFEYNKKGKVKKCKEVIIADEQDFVLNAVRFDSYKRKPVFPSVS